MHLGWDLDDGVGNYEPDVDQMSMYTARTPERRGLHLRNQAAVDPDYALHATLAQPTCKHVSRLRDIKICTTRLKFPVFYPLLLS
jgi:hypothetical protein